MVTPRSALLLTLVALSGAASLTYELLWIRALGRHFGTSTPRDDRRAGRGAVPGTVERRPQRQAQHFSVSGGSGTGFTFSFTSNESGATLDSSVHA